MTFALPSARAWLQGLAGLAVAVAAGYLFSRLRTPIPWMLGPLLMTASASLLGVPVYSAMPLRNTGQWVIGTALGLYFTPAVGSLVASLWWVIALGVVWACLSGWCLGRWLDKTAKQLPAAPVVDKGRGNIK